jgi:subtilase family serine protease
MTQRTPSCVFEGLESRCLLSADLPVMTSALQPAGNPHGRPVQQVSYTPSQVRQAYGFDHIAGDGTGETIAIVDAYHAPNVATDLASFNSTYHISGTGGLTTVYAQGSQPAFNDGWAQEITLDVEWAHAIAPGANILLVETATNSFDDLLGGVDYARQHGATVVSMSWGGYEFRGETGYDFHFADSNVTFVASSGDFGGAVQWPSASPNVVAVGGTSLTLTSSDDYKSETGWGGSGGGVSKYEAKPSYQIGVGGTGAKRTVPDVAYVADPNTGVKVIYNGQNWIFGGTSVGAPQWAALIAIANQGRASHLGSVQTLNALYVGYKNDKVDLNDIIAGSAGGNRALAGYDMVTGIGSPIVGSPSGGYSDLVEDLNLLA